MEFYYQQNAHSLLEIPWNLSGELTPEEAIAISQSVKEFQAGENSEGKHLYQDAQKYSERTGDQDYILAIKMFIAEEQRHARDLARFPTLNKISLVKTTFTDVVFRKLRHLFGGLEISIAILITAEIIAKVYYAALREATKSKILIGLCDQILRDEVKHVQFQSEQLFKLRSNRNRLGLIWTMGLQRFLFFGTVFVVWLFHREVFLRGNFSFQRYWQACWQEFNETF